MSSRINYTYDDQTNIHSPDDFADLGIVMQDFANSVPQRQTNHGDKYVIAAGAKRNANTAGLDTFNTNTSSLSPSGCNELLPSEGGSSDDSTSATPSKKVNGKQMPALSNGKKTKGRVKIKMEFIDNKLRRYTTFSKRKTGIMKKAYELSTLTGTQVMLLVASETGHVYTFATRKLQPMITSEAGKALIQTCLNSPDIPSSPKGIHPDQRMCATGFEETELTYNIGEDETSKRMVKPENGIGPVASNPFNFSLLM
ncbi:Serum response factor [Nymphon striatum]|nr:Serum response factor [Nymphon striatum]